MKNKNKGVDTTFTTVAKVKSGKLTSSLFNFMASNPWLDLLPPKQQFSGPTDDARYYIINLDLTDAIAVYKNPQFKLVERHIRIDEKFGTEESALATQKLFTHWHYTETYKKIDDPKQKVYVRCYYNYNRLLSAYATEQEDFKTEITDQAMLVAAEHNCQPAKEIINNLISRLSEARNKAISDLNKIIETLSNPNSVCYGSIERIRQELAKCKSASDRLNSLNEEQVDCRYDRVVENVNQRIKRIELLAAPKPIVTLVPNANPIEPAINATATNKDSKTTGTASLVMTQQQDLEKLLKKTATLEGAYKTASAKQLLVLNSERDSLQDEAFILSFEIKGDKNKKLHISLESRLNALPKLLNRAIEYAMNADVESVIDLFDHVKQEIPNSFYIDLYLHIVNKNELTADQEKKYVKLMRFMYENSDMYRLFISIFSIMLTEHKSQDGRCINYSLIGLFTVKGLHLLVKEFIEQFGSAEVGAYRYDNYTVPLVNMVAQHDESGELLKTLLDKGAITENAWLSKPSQYNYVDVPKVDISKESSKIHKDMALFFSNSGVSGATVISKEAADYILRAWSRYAPIASAFYAHVNNFKPKPDVVLRLLPLTNDFNFALGFAYVTLSGSYALLASNAGKLDFYKIYDNFDLCQEAVNGYKKPTHDAKRISFLTCPDDVILPIVGIVVNEAKRRFENCSKECIDATISKLDIFAKKQHEAKNYWLEIVACNAKLLLLSFEDPSVEMHASITQTCYALANACENDIDSPIVKSKQDNVRSVRNIIKILEAPPSFKQILAFSLISDPALEAAHETDKNIPAAKPNDIGLDVLGKFLWEGAKIVAASYKPKFAVSVPSFSALVAAATTADNKVAMSVPICYSFESRSPLKQEFAIRGAPVLCSFDLATIESRTKVGYKPR